MRVLMTPNIAKLYDEVKSYYDETFHLVADAPKEIKEKEAIIQSYIDLEEAKSEKMNR